MAEVRPKWVGALEPVFRTVFHEVESSFESHIGKVFNVHNSDKAFEKDTSLSGLSQLVETPELGAIPYEDQDPGFEVTYNHRKFTLARLVSQEMIDDEKWNIIRRIPETLSKAKMRTKEQSAADILNYGFTAGGGGLAPFTGGDAKALFATDHTNKQGTITQSNHSTAALTQSALESVITTMRKRKDSKGQILGYNPNTLIVPVELAFDAQVILNTAQQTTTANNDINPLNGLLNLVVWPYLTSSTAWFVVDSSAHDLNFFNRKDSGLNGPEYSWDNEAAKWKVSARWSLGFSDWKGIYGSTGTV